MFRLYELNVRHDEGSSSERWTELDGLLYLIRTCGRRIPKKAGRWIGLEEGRDAGFDR